MTTARVLLLGVLACALVAGAAGHQHAVNGTERAPGQSWAVFQRVLGTEPTTPFRWSSQTILALILACCCALLANAAGVGGGPFYVPLITVLLGFDLKAATALSHSIVSVSAIASSVYGLIQTSPNDPRRTLIDFDIALTFIPALLLGVSIGVLGNTLFPTWLQTLLLTVLLVLVVFKTADKGKRQWRSEQRDMKRMHSLRHNEPLPTFDDEMDEDLDKHNLIEEATLPKSSLGHLINDRLLEDTTAHDNASLADTMRAKAAKAERRLEDVGRHIKGFFGRLPYIQIVAVLVLWAAFLASQQAKSRYHRCTPQYFGVFALQVVVLLAIIAAAIWWQARKAQGGSDDMDPEMRAIMLGGGGQSPGAAATVRTLARVAAVMVFAGLTAGLLGIGGALIFNPVLLALGVQPQVTASTAVLMILFSSSAIALSFFFQGLLNTSYAAVLAPACFVASLIGVTVVGRIIKKSGRASIIIFILTGLIAAGCLLNAVFGGVRSYENIRAGTDIGFRRFCD